MEPDLQPHMRKAVPRLATFLPLNWKGQSYRVLGSPGAASHLLGGELEAWSFLHPLQLPAWGPLSPLYCCHIPTCLATQLRVPPLHSQDAQSPPFRAPSQGPTKRTYLFGRKSSAHPVKTFLLSFKYLMYTRSFLYKTIIHKLKENNKISTLLL